MSPHLKNLVVPRFPLHPQNLWKGKKKKFLHSCYVLPYFKIILRHKQKAKFCYIKTTHSDSYLGRVQHLSLINLGLIQVYTSKEICSENPDLIITNNVSEGSLSFYIMVY